MVFGAKKCAGENLARLTYCIIDAYAIWRISKMTIF
jgi:hypothetical protein